MDVSKQQLTELFRRFTDAELLRHLQTETLTPLATEVASAELGSRGIAAQSVKAEASANVEDALGEGQPGLVTIAEFWDSLQANVLRGRLESEGISGYVWSEPVGTPDVSGGPTRVQVEGNQAEQAREVMSSIERGEFAIPDSPETKTSDTDPLKFARRAARSGAIPFALLTISVLLSGSSPIRVLASAGSSPMGAATGVAIALQLLVAGVLLHLAWRTYRTPTVLLCSIATVLAAWDFVGAFTTRRLGAFQLTEIVVALSALYSALVLKNSKIPEPRRRKRHRRLKRVVS